MNILIISDLHIGSNGNFDNFSWDTGRFIKKVEKIKIKYNVDKLILNGDIFDLYQYSFEDIRANKKQLIDYLINENNIYIRGNHDIFNDFAVDHYKIINSKGKTIYIEHGHNADFLNGTNLGRFISIVGYKLLKAISSYRFVMKAYNRAVEKNDMVDRVPKKYNSIQYLSYALRLLKSYDVVVLGHTHKIESHKTYFLTRKKLYINCGTCSLGRFQGVIIDTETLKYETIKIASKKESRHKKSSKKTNNIPIPKNAEKPLVTAKVSV